MGRKSQGRGDAKNGPRWIWFEELDEIRKEVELVMGNETLEQVCSSMRDGDWGCDRCGDNCDCPNAESIISSFADRILSAHNREMAAADAEIDNLKKENARLRVIVSGATVSDGNLSEEIGRLREIVKELADALDSYPCHYCKHGYERCEWCDTVHELDALVSKAREVVK